MNRIIDVLGI